MVRAGGDCTTKCNSGFLIIAGPGRKFSGVFGVGASGCDASLLPVVCHLLKCGRGLTACWSSLAERVCTTKKSLSRVQHLLGPGSRLRRLATDLAMNSWAVLMKTCFLFTALIAPRYMPCLEVQLFQQFSFVMVAAASLTKWGRQQIPTRRDTCTGRTTTHAQCKVQQAWTYFASNEWCVLVPHPSYTWHS